mmetsp:Transcript_27348/g.58505  ORF Transcript_27348/g.58505 Transcript_27348/m.58505 type:complete len:209 (+) Transcript_27348:1613-2239(+)
MYMRGNACHSSGEMLSGKKVRKVRISNAHSRYSMYSPSFPMIFKTSGIKSGSRFFIMAGWSHIPFRTVAIHSRHCAAAIAASSSSSSSPAVQYWLKALLSWVTNWIACGSMWSPNLSSNTWSALTTSSLPISFMIRKYSVNSCGRTGKRVSSAPSASIKKRRALLASICTGNAGSLSRCNMNCNKVRKLVPSSDHETVENCCTIQHAR